MTSSLVTTSKLLQSLSGILITKDSEPPGQIIGAGLQSKQELLAITIHTVLILAGFRFIGTGEEGELFYSNAGIEWRDYNINRYHSITIC
jgi:hypothetical protein